MKPNLPIQIGSWVKNNENTSLQQALYFTSLPYFSRAADQGLKCQGCFSIWVYLWWLTLHTSPTISSFSWAVTDHHHLWTLAFCSLISTFLYPPILIYEHTCSLLLVLSQPGHSGSVVFHPTCTHSLLIRVDRCLCKISPVTK